MSRKALKIVASLAMVMLAMVHTACVHEFPESPETRRVNLRVTHQLDWSLYDYVNPGRSSRTIDDDKWMWVEYLFEVHPAGTTETPLMRFREYVEYSDRLPMATVVELPPGEYDIWIWSQFFDPSTGEAPYFDTESFGAIKLKGPYVGSTYQKDAHQGCVRVFVPSTTDAQVDLNYSVELTRPLTAHAFIATDVDEFIEMETKRRSVEERENTVEIDFSKYTAKVIHTGYMINEYSMYRSRPTDSALGVTFTSPLEVTPDGEVLIAYDTLFINGEESTLSLGIEIYDPDGKLVSTVGNITIPTKLNRGTIVRGDFLTSKASGGIGIDKDFEGDFNIEI